MEDKPETIELIRAMLKALNIAMNAEGDVFGINHNWVTDAMSEAEVYLKNN